MIAERGLCGIHKDLVMYRLAHEIKNCGFTPSAVLTLSSHTFIAEIQVLEVCSRLPKLRTLLTRL